MFSTTCDGTVLWSQAIGGQGPLDRAFNLVLDSNNNVYVGVHINATGSIVSFSPNSDHSIAPLPNPEAYKRIYLVKYNSSGQFQEKKALQGNVNSMNNQAQLLDLFIDNDIIHFITGLRPGTHLDNNITVPDSTIGFQYFLTKYDTNLEYLHSLLLPITDGTGFSDTAVRFVYDKNLNRYYIGGTREDGSDLIPLTYDSKTVVNRSFLLAVNGVDGNAEWLREIYSNPFPGQPLPPNLINSLRVDNTSDIYIGGSVYRSPDEQGLKFYDPSDTSVSPYLFTPGATWTIPMISKLNSNGDVQWIQTTNAYNANALTPGPRYGADIAINNDEVGLTTQGANEYWDNFQIQRSVSYQADPLLIRFNKQTGAVLAIHEIPGSSTDNQRLTVITADNDGNYVAGGLFTGSLFINNSSNVLPLYSVGEIDFFVAKLAASVCGTTVSSENFNKINVNVYPNPTRDIVNIEADEVLLAYTVYDTKGRKIQKGSFENTNQIDLKGTSNGTYFIELFTTGGNSTKIKIIKK